MSTPENTPHVILVAFTVNAPDAQTAEHGLRHMLPRPGKTLKMRSTGSRSPIMNVAPVKFKVQVESWWIAEDDRHDGSDNDSAVFVHTGSQHEAWQILAAASLTGLHNEPVRHSPPIWEEQWDLPSDGFDASDIANAVRNWITNQQES
jgi:hypothetical protein